MNNKRSPNKELKKMSTMAVKRAYDYIRDMTIDFLIRPGEQINEIEIANNLELSRVPVREALNRLVVGGFVFFEPSKGFFCRKFSEAEMKELYDVRLDIELGSVRQACRCAGKDDDISDIQSDWKKIADAYATMTKEELINQDELFHIKIAGLSGNMQRIAFMQNIYERIRFVRKINIEKPARNSSFVVEHLDLIHAILEHDEALSVSVMEHHLGVNSRELTDNIHTGMLRIYASDV